MADEMSRVVKPGMNPLAIGAVPRAAFRIEGAEDKSCLQVLQVIPGVAARYGGPSCAVLEICRALEGQGVESLLATTDADGAGRLPVELRHTITYNGVRAIFFPRQFSEAFKYSYPLATWLESNMKNFDLAEIHAVFSHSSLAAARACQLSGVPYVIRPLGSLDRWSLKHKPLRKWLLWHAGVKQMLCGAAAIHYTTSEECRDAETSLGLKRGIVLPLGVNEEVLNSPADPRYFRERYPVLGKDPYVLVLSRLHPVKGLELLLDVFLDVAGQDRFKDWRLVIGGDGDAEYVAELQRIVRQRGGVRQVLFTGWLDGRLKIAALRGAALFALTSHHENFGLSVVEALGCAVPVLISTNVSLAEQVRASGAGWVSKMERSSLLDTLTEALLDEDRRARYGCAGRELVYSRFIWPKIGAELADIYRSIVKKARSYEL